MITLVKGEWYKHGVPIQYCGPLLRPDTYGHTHIFQRNYGYVIFLDDSEVVDLKTIPRTITVELPKPLVEMPDDGILYVLDGSIFDGWSRFQLNTYGATQGVNNRIAYATQAEAEAAVAALRKAGHEFV